MGRYALVKDNMKLASEELVTRGTRVLGPPGELALGKSFHTKPEALAVIDDYFYSCALFVGEDKEFAGERVMGEGGAAHSGQPVDTFAEVNGMKSEENGLLRGELKHGVTP